MNEPYGSLTYLPFNSMENAKTAEELIQLILLSNI